jgi:hypothetical protein
MAKASGGRWRKYAAGLVAAGALGGVLGAADEFVALHVGDTAFAVMCNERAYLDLSVGGWGKNWSWQGWQGTVSSGEGAMTVDCVSGNLRVRSVYTPTAKGFSVASTLTAAKAEEVTLVMLGCTFPGVGKGTWTAIGADGQTLIGDLPFQRGALDGLGTVARLEVAGVDGQPVRLLLSPPIPVPIDHGGLRLQLAAGRVEPGREHGFTMDVELPGKTLVYTDPSKAPGTPGFERWYAFAGTGHPVGESYLDMADWSAAIGGRRIEMAGDRLLQDGRPVKLWGLNVCYGDCAPQKDLADRRADLYRRYGINTVRLHKYADGSGWQGILAKDDAAAFDPEGLDRLDYFVSRLKAAGIHVKLSPIFYVKPRAANRAGIPYFDEFEARDGVAQTGGGAMYLGTELQELQMRQMAALLSHRNPYTGMTYAEDPVVAVIEITNEDSVLFFGTLAAMQRSATLRQRAGERFTAWLRQKYGTEAALLAAWGEGMLGTFKAEKFPSESWERNEIYPVGNPWFYSPDQLAGSQANRRARLLDTIVFLKELQDEAYARLADSLRQAGYTGPLVASNWQAGEGASHYANLRSDATVGIVDRHNYFGGGDGRIVRNASMLALPGSGTLSSAFQQVKDRPFMISEWIHVLPNEWGVEGPAIIGAYGMGLQGWDVSCMFQNNDGGAFLKGFKPGRYDVWQVSAPQVLGIFPAVARMVRRGDVREARTTHPLNVHLPSFLRGEWGFRDTTRQEHDIKSFATDVVPTEALAVSRIAVDFTDEAVPTPPFDLAPHRRGDAIVSDTGELSWVPGNKPMDGHFTIDTDGTAALCGFAEGRTADLKAAQITLRSRYGAVFLTARAQDKTLANDRHVLVSAIARARNQGASVLMDSIIQEPGNPQGPIVMEPVVADLVLRRQDEATVHILDHDGVKTGRTLPCDGGRIAIDTARDQTPYYLVEYR